MSRLERAEELRGEIAHILGAAVTVTTNPLNIAPALSAGHPVVAIQPPDLSFPTWHSTEATWEIYVIAGPFADQYRAWETIDGIISELVEPLAVDTAKAATFAHPGTPEYPAYVLTFTETT